MPDLEIDNLTLLLLAAIVSLLLYDRLSRPAALVHPLLLGKQAEVSAVRKEGESGVYRSFATGHGTPLIVRPASSLKTVRDVVPASKGPEDRQRVILDTPLANDALAELVRLLPLGLASLFSTLSSDPLSPTPILVLLPPSPSTSLPLLLLSLASSPSTPLVILPTPAFLIPALDSNAHAKPGLVVVHESLAESVVEQIKEAGEGTGVLIVGDNGDKWGELGEHGVEVRFWDEVWDAGERSWAMEGVAPEPNDVHSYFYTSTGPEAELTITKFTHLNFTAGIAGFLSTFPADKRPNSLKNDILACSEPLTTPMGMTIALASIWTGVGFSLIGSPTASWIRDNTLDPLDDLKAIAAAPTGSKPSILILTAKQHFALTKSLHNAYLKSPFGTWALNSKIADVQAGHLSRNGRVWDKLVWRDIWNSPLNGLLGDTLRSIIVIGQAPSESALAWSNVLLSIPTARLFPSEASAGPVLASHFYDVQSSASYLASKPTDGGARAHTGAPTSNVEVVLRGVVEPAKGAKGEGKVEVVEGGRGSEGPIEGRLWARGPVWGERVTGGEGGKDGWVQVAPKAGVRTNGTFLISSS